MSPTPLEVRRKQLKQCGEVLRDLASAPPTLEAAESEVNSWRALHAYPINTFQATLRLKLKKLGALSTVAQRLKRTPSIVAKLRRERSLELHKMQDIGGLRAIVPDLVTLRRLEESYSRSRFSHKSRKKDYVTNPKSSGYRSIHLIYTYNKPKEPLFDGLMIELQLRTKLQHAWATAVETAGTFLGQALKSSEGTDVWLKFFSLAGSAFSLLEGGPPVPGYEHLSECDTYTQTFAEARRLDVERKLRAFTSAINVISSEKKKGVYHVLRLNAAVRSLTWVSFSKEHLNMATNHYKREENLHRGNPSIQVVLVAADSVRALKRAYPNYFLNTDEFLSIFQQMRKKRNAITPDFQYELPSRQDIGLVRMR